MVTKVNGALPRATEHSAGYDMVSTAEDFILEADTYKMVPTGVYIENTDPNTVGLVCSRSGLAAKYGIFVLNAPGIVDADYTGEVKVILCNTTDKPYRVNKGDRIAQLVLTTWKKADNDVCAETVRGDGGFGSTGA